MVVAVRRLASFRPLTAETAQLEFGTSLADSMIGEAVRELDLGAVAAWLQDRGQETYVDRLRFLRGVAVARLASLWPSRAFFADGRDGERVLWASPVRPFFPDEFGGLVQSTHPLGLVDRASFYTGSTSWQTSQYMATTAAPSSH